MLTKFAEKLSMILIPILEYGWILAIPLGVLYFIFPDSFDSLFVRLIIIILLAIIILFFVLALTLGLGKFVFGKYADEYQRLVRKGEDRTTAFAKTSLKALVIFIILFLLALIVILKDILFEPRAV